MINRGVGKVAYVLFGSRTVAIEVCLLFNFAVVFNFNVLPFPPSKSKLICDVLVNGETRHLGNVFFSFITRFAY
jgi:hypothetical protein